MYKVDVTNLRLKLGELNKLLETYQENYLNFYYQIEISQSEEYWIDPHAIDFYDDKTLEKSNMEESYNELNEVYRLINYIVNMYSSLGNIVEFDLSYRNDILSKFNVYRNKLNRIYNSYKDLNYSFASPEINRSINNQIRIIKDQIYLCDELKDSIRDIMDNINNYENDISKLIKDVYISKIQSVDVEKYCSTENKDQAEKCIINTEEISNIIKKMNLYSDLESSNFIGILNNFKSILSLYNTKNTLALDNLSENINNKFNNIKDNNINNLEVYKRNIDKYKTIDEEVTSSAKEIGV